MSKRGRKRSVSYEAVIAYAEANPTMYQYVIAAHFKTTKWRVSAILRAAGIYRKNRGAPIKRKPNQTEEEHKWELILQQHGLGIDRGLRLGNKRIYYGQDPCKEEASDESVTLNSYL